MALASQLSARTPQPALFSYPWKPRHNQITQDFQITKDKPSQQRLMNRAILILSKIYKDTK
jgi:hypothetical protein